MLSTHSAKYFLMIFNLYSIFRLDCLGRGFRGFNPDIYQVFSYIVCGGGYGVSVRGCCFYLYNSDNSANHRSVGHRVKWLIDSGLVVKFKYKGRYRYRISSHAEKLILKSLGKDVIRDCALYIKSCLKD